MASFQECLFVLLRDRVTTTGAQGYHLRSSKIVCGVRIGVKGRGDRESDFLGFREASGLDTISRHFPAGIGKFVNI